MQYSDNGKLDPDLYEELSSFDVFYGDYQKALAWVTSYTKVSPHSRWRGYERHFDKVLKELLSSPKGEAEIDSLEHRNAFYEAAQLVRIYKVFKDLDCPGIDKKLSIVAKGTNSYKEEKINSQSRNIAFELFFAANFINVGLNVSLGDESTRLEDLRIHFDEFDLYVECKRPGSPNSVEDLTEHAFAQLTTRLIGAERPAFGAVAFCIDRVSNPNFEYIRTNDPRGPSAALNERAKQFTTQHYKKWNKKRPKNVNLVFAQLTGFAFVGEEEHRIFSTAMAVEKLVPLLNEDAILSDRAARHVMERLQINTI